MSATQTSESFSASAFRQSSLQYPATRVPASQNSPVQALTKPPEPKRQYFRTHTRCAAELGLRSNGTEIRPYTSPNPRPRGNRSCTLCRRGRGQATLLPPRFAIHPAQLRLWSSPTEGGRDREWNVPLPASPGSSDTSLHPGNAGISQLLRSAESRWPGCRDPGETGSAFAAAKAGSQRPAADFHPVDTVQPACRDSSSSQDPR